MTKRVGAISQWSAEREGIAQRLAFTEVTKQPSPAGGEPIGGHQYACPSDTYTATAGSPGWGLSGVPTSTRIGPKAL